MFVSPLSAIYPSVDDENVGFAFANQRHSREECGEELRRISGPVLFQVTRQHLSDQAPLKVKNEGQSPPVPMTNDNERPFSSEREKRRRIPETTEKG